MPLHVKQGGTWYEVGATGLSAKDQDQWRDIQNGYVKVAGVWEQFFVRSDPITSTHIATASSSFKKSGSNYTAAQKTQRQNLAYYGKSSVREEGALVLFDYAAIQSAIATRPVCSEVTIRTSYQHSYAAAGETVRLAFHGETSLGSDPDTGWVAPITTYAQTVAWGKSTSPVRVTKTITGATAQSIADAFAAGTYKGITIDMSAPSVNDWGWGVGAVYQSTGETGGVPDGYEAVTSGTRIEIEFDLDYV